MRLRHSGVLILGMGALLGCARDEPEKIEVAASTRPFFVQRDSLATIRFIGEDSLSDSATVQRLVPEPDGRSIAVVFADPALGIHAGLALLEPQVPRVRLVWPDSVGAVWWSGEHRLAFESRTGTTGVRAVVDVHADSLEQLVTTSDSVPANAIDTAADDAARARATAYIDSVRRQPGGVPQEGTLRYLVTALAPSDQDSVIAFYVSARGGSDEALNPAWYLLHLPSGRVAAIDSVTGRANALRAQASAWSGDRFIYARGDVLYEARVADATRSVQ